MSSYLSFRLVNPLLHHQPGYKITGRSNSNHVSPSKNLKILMLHGFTQSGSLYESKTQTLRKEMREAILPATSRYRDINFVFPTAPFALERHTLPTFDIDGVSKQDEELDAYTWWHFAGQKPPFRYDGIETAMSHIADTIIREGPFDGAMGFSQGAAITAMLESLLEPGRKNAFENAQADGGIAYPGSFLSRGAAIQPPLKFAVEFSGFGSIRNPLYSAFYSPKIITPILHVLGKADNFIKPAMSQELIDNCTNSQIAHHPGTHAVPNEPGCADEVARFLKEVLGL